MKRVLIFGNSGSGKTTLAKKLGCTQALAHLDLDSLAWESTNPPERKALPESEAEINRFVEAHSYWVIEGCYADLIKLAVPYASEMIFMDLDVESCIENAISRPWEPHKYPSKAAQDRNLDMLIDWIRQYPHRDDCFSRESHLAIYQAFTGDKRLIEANESFETFDCHR